MHDIITLEEPSTEIADRLQLFGESICPDCFDAMIKFYDRDTIRYVCEDCDLTSRETFCEDEERKRE